MKTTTTLKTTIFISFITLLLFGICVSTALANPIYVYTQSDGTIRFTTVKPKGVPVKVFTASGRGSYNTSYKRGLPGRLYKYRFDSIIRNAASRHKVDPALVKAVIHAESAFNPNAVSHKGAQGLMQLMPKTAKWLGVRSPLSVSENVEGGVKYLARLINRYKGNVRFALAAYNAGIKAVSRYKGVPPYNETRNYVQKVLRLKSRYNSL